MTAGGGERQCGAQANQLTRRTRNILGSVALVFVVLGILPLVLGVVQLVLAVSGARGAMFRVALIPIAIGVAAIAAGLVLDRWLRQRTAEAPRGFDVIVSLSDGADRP